MQFKVGDEVIPNTTIKIKIRGEEKEYDNSIEGVVVQVLKQHWCKDGMVRDVLVVEWYQLHVETLVYPEHVDYYFFPY